MLNPIATAKAWLRGEQAHKFLVPADLVRALLGVLGGYDEPADAPMSIDDALVVANQCSPMPAKAHAALKTLRTALVALTPTLRPLVWDDTDDESMCEKGFHIAHDPANCDDPDKTWCLIWGEGEPDYFRTREDAKEDASRQWAEFVGGQIAIPVPAQAASGGMSPDDRILWGVVANAGRLSSERKVRWSHVSDSTGLGSTYSANLCRRFGRDPDETVGGGEDDDAIDHAFSGLDAIDAYEAFVDEYWTHRRATRRHDAAEASEALRQRYIMDTGLAGETGEVLELLKKDIRDGVPLDRRELALELGDVIYYAARIALWHGISLRDVFRLNREKLNARREGGKHAYTVDHVVLDIKTRFSPLPAGGAS